MYDKEMAYSLVGLIIDHLRIIQSRTKAILLPVDFTSSDQGMILLDSVCMKLAAIGESLKNLDKITNKELLTNYPQVNWKQAMGMRDIIVHHYFDIDAEVVHKTLLEDLPQLLNAMLLIENNLQTSV